ncbi:MAG: hypothetical protein OEZ06_31335 [Myxococcales bacterium]|nr:hypothetical protein [Myxococcales bacterium]
MAVETLTGDESTCWADLRARRLGSQPTRISRLTLLDAAGDDWFLELPSRDLPAATSTPGHALELSFALETGEFWQRESLRIDDAEGLLLAVGCAPPGITAQRDGEPLCSPAANDELDPCIFTELYAVRLTADDLEALVEPGEDLDVNGYRVSATLGRVDLSACSTSLDGPGDVCSLRIVR